MKYKIGGAFPHKSDGQIQTIVATTTDGRYVLSNDDLCTEQEFEDTHIISPSERWRAEVGGKYYFLNDSGQVRQELELSWARDTERYEFGNYFPSAEDAKQARDLFAAWRILKDDTKRCVYRGIPEVGAPNKNQYFYRVFLDFAAKSLMAGFASRSYRDGNNLYFATKEDAEASIEAHPNEWMTFFGVKEQDGEN